MNLQLGCVWIVALVIMLSSCGGGGGAGNNNENVTSQIVTSSIASNSNSNSSFSSSEQIVDALIAPDNQSFELDEDNTLNTEIKTNLNYVLGSIDPERIKAETNTLKDGHLKIIVPDDGADPKLYFNYTPAEDFYGDDEVTIYLSKFVIGLPTQKQTIKLNFHVRSVVDEGLKVKINNNKIFSTGDKIYLSLPYNPDTNASVPTDTKLKLSIGDTPVDYVVEAEELAFTIPKNIPAGENLLNINFDFQGKPFHLTQRLKSKIDYGDVEYWMGDKGRPGVTYVVIAEQRVDRQKYLDWVNAAIPKFLNEPLLAQYSSYWNFAVIKELAPENYASLINEDKSAIIIANLQETGETFIKRYVPNYDWVILNTSLDGRETGGYPLVLRLSSVNTMLHEFGHVHAKLADEYADETVITDPVYLEGSNPNVTNFNNYESIPWKHWILDKTNIPGVNAAADPTGVGAFLGAFYTSTKFYRPMKNSIMNGGSDALGPIYSEAWVLATYERMGILGSVTNTKAANLRTFKVAKAWNKDLTRIDWFVNDIKQDAWENQETIIVDETKIATNKYSVKVELTDLSSYIKNPHAYPAFKLFNHPESASEMLTNLNSVANENFQKQWTFDKSLAAPATKLQKQYSQDNVQAAINNSDWVSHRIAIENGVHKLVSSSRYTLQDTLAAVTAHSEFRAEVFDKSGKQIYTTGVDNPYHYYHGEDGLVILKGSGSYQIKHPHINGSYQIAIVDLHTGQRLAVFDFVQ